MHACITDLFWHTYFIEQQQVAFVWTLMLTCRIPRFSERKSNVGEFGISIICINHLHPEKRTFDRDRCPCLHTTEIEVFQPKPTQRSRAFATCHSRSVAFTHCEVCHAMSQSHLQQTVACSIGPPEVERRC